MKNYKFKINGNEYSVDIVEIADNKAQVEVNGNAYEVELDMTGMKVPTAPAQPTRPTAAPVAPGAAAAAAPAAGGAGMQVKSPLPGTVLDVMVREGDTVTAGQHIILLEAMKMENNIEAPKAGKITNIRVKQRDAVMEGDVLLTIE